MRVPVKLLRCEWPPNDELKPGDPKFDKLLESIKKTGIMEPITINLKWFIIDGNHRLYAARILGIDSMEARVWTGAEFVE